MSFQSLVIIGIIAVVSAMLWAALRPIKLRRTFLGIYGGLVLAAVGAGTVLSFSGKADIWPRIAGFTLIIGPISYMLCDAVMKERERKGRNKSKGVDKRRVSGTNGTAEFLVLC